MLKSVQIRNFRSCFDTSFQFDRKLCAISGRNGVGKTNILKAIEWASSTVIVADSVRVREAGNHLEEVDSISVGFDLSLDGNEYRYHFAAPSLNRGFHKAGFPNSGISELLEIETGSSRTPIFRRDGEGIDLKGRSEQVRIPRSTPAIAALHSLLASDDPSRPHIDRLTRFFCGISYYSLDEQPLARDHVNEQAFNEWKFRYQDEGRLTSSVAMRLIYMWQEEYELFRELVAILGPDGMNLIDAIDVITMEATARMFGGPKEPGGGSSKLFMPLFRPSAHMGGAGDSYGFSDLSVGTRRLVRIIVFMLFDRRSLMLMEQPEDSIHPGLLRKLIDQLRTYSFDSQMLFTTHSLEVLDILQPEEILLATAPGGSTKVRTLTHDEIVRAKDFLQNEGTLSDFLEPLDDL